MLHISFGLYIVSLLSGMLLLSAFGNNPKYRLALGFREFITFYLIITVFVCITAVCLYLSVNVSTDNALREQILRIYLSTILLFLGLLPSAIGKYNSTIYGFISPPWFSGFLWFNAFYAVGGVVAIWLWAGFRQDLIIGFSITFFVVGFGVITWSARQSYNHVFISSTAKTVSRIMITQSLCLPLIEAVFWGEHLSRDGFTFSLPILFLVNNLLLWVYRDQLMPHVRESVALRDVESLLSPKEQEIVQSLAAGMSNKQIAAKLGITQSTVKNHIYNIFKKCNVTNRVALINHLRSE